MLDLIENLNQLIIISNHESLNLFSHFDLNIFITKNNPIDCTHLSILLFYYLNLQLIIVIWK